MDVDKRNDYFMKLVRGMGGDESVNRNSGFPNSHRELPLRGGLSVAALGRETCAITCGVGLLSDKLLTGVRHLSLHRNLRGLGGHAEPTISG